MSYNIVLVSGVQHGGSAMHIPTFVLFNYIIFHGIYVPHLLCPFLQMTCYFYRGHLFNILDSAV